MGTFYPKKSIFPQFYSKKWPEKKTQICGGFMFPSFFFSLLSAFFCLSFSSLPLLFDILKPKKVPTRWGLWLIFKRPKRGLKHFGHVSDRFSDLFSRFSHPFSYRSKNVSTLRLWVQIPSPVADQSFPRLPRIYDLWEAGNAWLKTIFSKRKRHINFHHISFSAALRPPSLSQGQTQFVPGTNWASTV